MTPLPDSVSVLLRSSSTAAMAALLLISTSHRGLLDWFSRTVCGDAPAADPEPQPRPKPRSNTRLSRGGKSPRRNGVHREPRGNDADSRRAKRDADDAALVEAMRVDPAGPLGAWSVAIGKSRTSVVSALQRLRDAGLVENEARQWRLLEEPAPRDPSPKWVAPLRGRDKSAVAHLNAAG